MKYLIFSQNLRKALEDNKMTQQTFADQIGISQAMVNRWLNGVNEPDFATLLTVCRILNISPNEILGYEE